MKIQLTRNPLRGIIRLKAEYIDFYTIILSGNLEVKSNRKKRQTAKTNELGRY